MPCQRVLVISHSLTVVKVKPTRLKHCSFEPPTLRLRFVADSILQNQSEIELCLKFEIIMEAFMIFAYMMQGGILKSC